jgi:hypothetical protein
MAIITRVLGFFEETKVKRNVLVSVGNDKWGDGSKKW